MKHLATVFAGLLILVGCAVESARTTFPPTEISIEENAFLYRGQINSEANARLFAIAKNATDTPSLLVITSQGGESLAGVELGRWVFQNRLDVQVQEYCVSSCANYVFTAGNRKFLNSSAAVVWHGGALQKEWNDPCAKIPRRALEKGLGCSDFEQAQAEYLEEFRSTEVLFFAEIGVDQRVTVLGQDPEYDCRRGSGFLGWYYSIDDLARLGIKNIHVRQGEWQPKSPTSELRICRVELDADFY